jgi:hypothetical protein
MNVLKNITFFTQPWKRMAESANALSQNPVYLARPMAILLLAFAGWNIVTFYFIQGSLEPVVSAMRLLIEGLIAYALIRWFPKAPERIMQAVLVLSSVSSLIVFIQILEEAQILPTPFRWIMTDFWHLYSEATRKTGLLNNFQVSSFLGFLSVVLLINRKKATSVALTVINSFSVLFGARTLCLLWPFLLMVNRRALIAMILVLSTMFMAGTPRLQRLLTYHFDVRLMPAVQVVATGDFKQDYSSKDTLSQYKAPHDIKTFWLGNGIPRYSEGGGFDPVASRWLLQAGLPAMILALALSFLVIVKIGLKPGMKNKVFAAALLLLMVKEEMITSTLGFPLLLLYGFAPPEADENAAEG